jgi:hypothetical protein
VVDPESDRFAQQGHGGSGIARGTECAGAGQLHGAITQSMQAQGSAREGELEVVSRFHGLLLMVA